MPLFGKKHIQKEIVPEKAGKVTKAPEIKVDKKAVKKAPAKAVAPKADKALAALKSSVIVKPRVTEKAGILAERGVYTFEVLLTANSQQIATAIKAAYKVTPVKISIAQIPSKSMFVRGKKGKTVRGKKAYVYLKKGDKIELA